MRVVVVGLGVQGHKRIKAAGHDVVAVVDPVHKQADYRDLFDVALDAYDAAMLCVPDEPKIDLISYLLQHGKHVLLEKPLLSMEAKALKRLQALALEKNVVCYTAYNHRFEPHFVRMAQLIQSCQLGRIYSVRLFYGNGTARLVRESQWRDQASGVLPDLGSHLLDTLLFWFDDSRNWRFNVTGAFCHENRAFDHVVLCSMSSDIAVQLEMSLLSWRNHFTCDIVAEKGSAHIESLCKWGPSRFTKRMRVLPAGRPPEESTTLAQEDPTWDLEYAYFKDICNNSGSGNLDNDIWINETLISLAQEAGVGSVLPTGKEAAL